MTCTFVVQATDGGSALPRLAQRLTPLIRPGDQLVWVDTGSKDDTPAQLARLNGQIETKPPLLDTQWVLFLTATSRPRPAAFVSARRAAQADVDAVFGPQISPLGAFIRVSTLADNPPDWARLYALQQGAHARMPRPLLDDPPPALTQADLTRLADLPRAWAQGIVDSHTTGPGARAVLAPGTLSLPAPTLQRPAALTFCLAGMHAHRTPLAWPHLKPLWSDHLTQTDDPSHADLVIWGHPRDLTQASRAAARARNHVLLSEEPFWDSLFSPDPLARRITLPAPHAGLIRLHQRNHHTSEVFAHQQLPYYLLTQPGFIPAYQALFQRNQALSPTEWQVDFARRSATTFMAERRPEAFHDLHIAGGDIAGLCAWRTRLAMTAPGDVQRLGASWGTAQRSRFNLADWHADKLVRMDRGPRILSGIENTHQPAYLSEKLFDAFACGTRPLYYASPRHRVHDLGLPARSWVNLHDHTSDQAATTLATLSWDDGFFAAYAQAQTTLAALFSDPAILTAERARLGAALLSDLAHCADLGPA